MPKVALQEIGLVVYMLFLGLGSLLISYLFPSVFGVGAQAVTRLVLFLLLTDLDDCCCWLFFLCSFVSLVSV